MTPDELYATSTSLMQSLLSIVVARVYAFIQFLFPYTVTIVLVFSLFGIVWAVLKLRHNA